MSVERTREILTAYLDALGQRGAYGQYLADTSIFTLMDSGQEVKGRVQVEQFIRSFHEQAFDAHPEIVSMVIGDARAAIEWVFVGTHTGEFGGVGATGKHVNVPYAAVYDFDGDKITAIRLYMPMDVLMQQISGAPMLAEAAA